ncbi:Insulin-like growth factor-binding protein 1 [Acipenser ruthenus]|uniref:Insulin-like growth factor-binding protein 1 n=1 Tax=Acipenser ruthenus TaxID=7906 RepID=A0A444UJK2_ACIRT|nr:Insulin-like growth factor-binding protein 1 [Acipenser ruthenus]
METIMECDPSDECEDETSFLNVKRPGRRSSFLVKHSTPFASEVSELTVHMLSEINVSRECLQSRKTYQGSIASKQILHSGMSSDRGTLSPVQSLNEEDSSSSLSLHLPEHITLPTKTDRMSRKIRMKSVDGDEVSIQHLKERKRSKAWKFSEGPCHIELSRELDKIAKSQQKMGEKFNRFHLPNCDRHGFYRAKQCEASLDGERGKCWCVYPWNGKSIPGSPEVRGDPECQQYLALQEQDQTR